MRRHLRGILLATLVVVVAFGLLWAMQRAASPSTDGTNIHRAIVLGCVAIGAVLATVSAGAVIWMRSWPARVLLVVAGVLALWASLVIGTGAGYRAWQAMPEPPEAAFADGGPLVFSLLLGWLPATVFVGLAMLVLWLFKKMIDRIAPMDHATDTPAGSPSS